MAHYPSTEEQEQMVLQHGWDHWTDYMESRLCDGEMFHAKLEVDHLLTARYLKILGRLLVLEEGPQTPEEIQKIQKEKRHLETLI